MTVPKCCGKRMRVNLETPRFIEVHCDVCNDIVYIKKDDVQEPQLLDD
jgi:hypothetical protein